MDELVAELGDASGPCERGWADGVVPQDEGEFDCLFALFRRAGVWAYVRICAPQTDTPACAYLRLIFGVFRKMT